MWIGPPPWPHQLGAFDAGVAALRAARGRGLVAMPTGCGKSRVMRALAYWVVQQRRRAVLCVPTEEILEQLAADLRKETRTPFYREKAHDTAPSYSLITIASHQTLWRRLHKYDPRVVLLFDECHHSNGQALKNLSTLDRFDQVLGFTASPWSEDCHQVYQDRVLHRYGLSEAIAAGFLCGYELWPFPDIVPRPGSHELYYCADNDQARAEAKQCPHAGYLGYDTTPEERGRILAGFRAGILRRLYINRMLCEGFDCPSVGTIWIDKESDSDVLNYQMVGRGLRRKPDGRGLVVYARDVAGIKRALARAG